MTIERVKVLERDGKPARFLGMTIREMLVLLALVFLTNMFFRDRILLLLVAATYLVWIKKVRDFLPERYFTRMLKFYWLPNNLYRAGSRCAEWRDPVRPD